MPRLVVVTGTGTEIGKTHVAESLLRAMPRTFRSTGYKPVESGVDDGEGEDGRRLREASMFHVKHPPLRYVFRTPVSPHVAARLEGRSVDVDAIVASVTALLTELDILILELPGGLFSPVTDNVLNVDLLARLTPTLTLLVASDRLGVLHDVTATTRAAKVTGVTIDAVALSAPAVPDASTGSNAAELARIGAPPVLATVPRATPFAIVASGVLDALVRRITSG